MQINVDIARQILDEFLTEQNLDEALARTNPNPLASNEYLIGRRVVLGTLLVLFFGTILCGFKS